MKTKIVVSYHRPFTLFKSDVLTPIHVGRSVSEQISKDVLLEEDKNSFFSNMLGDDTGDNISDKNRSYSELTAQYWAWKNLDKLENPDYIGFCHYRRHFILNDMYKNKNLALSFGCCYVSEYSDSYLEEIGFTDKEIEKTMEDCDVLAFKPLNLSTDFPEYMPQNLTPRTNYASYDILDVKDFDKAIEIIKKKYPDFIPVVDEYINGNIMYGYNIFVMKKEIFIDYSNWFFDILFELEKNINWDEKSIDEYRGLACVAEQLYGIYISKLIKDGKYKVKHKPLTFLTESFTENNEIDPAFQKNNIPVIFASDENYVPYLATTIESLIQNSTEKYNYDILVLETKINNEDKKIISDLSASKKNISIRFYNIESIVDEYGEDLFHVFAHFSKATYYRFFIPKIFNNYEKALYLDCDIIILDDVANLYNHELDGFLLGGAKEYFSQVSYKKSDEYKNYIDNVLKLKENQNYFNAGVLICNIKEMKQFGFTEKCVKKLREIKTPLTVDQDVLNSVCEGRVKYFDFSWNYCWHPYFCCFDDMKKYLSFKNFSTWISGRKDPKIIHYTSAEKPWNSPQITLAQIWWKYAREIPYYEEILFRNIKITENISTNQKKNKITIKQVKYKILSKIMFGKIRKKYKEKYKKLVSNKI